MGLCPQFTSKIFLKIIGQDEVDWFKKGIFKISDSSLKEEFIKEYQEFGKSIAKKNFCIYR